MTFLLQTIYQSAIMITCMTVWIARAGRHRRSSKLWGGGAACCSVLTKGGGGSRAHPLEHFCFLILRDSFWRDLERFKSVFSTYTFCMMITVAARVLRGRWELFGMDNQETFANTVCMHDMPLVCGGICTPSLVHDGGY